MKSEVREVLHASVPVEVGKALFKVVHSAKPHSMVALRFDDGGERTDEKPDLVVLIGKGMFAEVLAACEKATAEKLAELQGGS
jgi:hypothetical protein